MDWSVLLETLPFAVGTMLAILMFFCFAEEWNREHIFKAGFFLTFYILLMASLIKDVVK